MEEGYFQVASIDTDFIDEQVKNVPVPAEIPKPYDFSQVPRDILRSGVIESLLNQNEDLMARLTVSLRRSSQLEAQLNHHNRDVTALQHKNGILQEQLLVLKEKDRVVAERGRQFDEEVSALKDQIQLLETRYAELFSVSQERTRALRESVNTFSRRVSRFLKYKRNIAKVAKPLKQRNQRLVDQLGREQSQLIELRTKLGDTVQRLQEQHKITANMKSQLVESYENQLLELHNQIDTLKRQNQELLEKSAQWDQLYLSKVDVENTLVAEMRSHESFKKNSDAQIRILQTDLLELRVQLKQRLFELEEANKDLRQTQFAEQSAKQQMQALSEQVESLQLLWKNQQQQIEKVEDKNRSLQKLNQQLSTSLNQSRKELQQTREELEKERLLTAERMKQLATHVQLLETQKNHDFYSPENQQHLDRINALFAEIQSGFSSTASSRIDKSLVINGGAKET